MPTQRIGDLINIAAHLTRMAPADITGQEKYNPIMRVRLAVYKVAADWGVHSRWHDRRSHRWARS
jgi:hypothetical protein